MIEEMNWLAIVVGALAAFGLGMVWFSPIMFGKAWVEGSHRIKPPDSPPVAAMLVQGLGTLALALVVGATVAAGLTGTAVLAVLAASILTAGMDLFSQKSAAATLIDAGYIAAMGAIMGLAHAIL